MLIPVLPPKRSPVPPQSADQGLTLIECLVAIVMVALVAGSVAPVMVISVASRVNSQKAEQALGLAQAEIDRTRTQVERGEHTLATLPPEGRTTSGVITEKDKISEVLGPNLSETNSTSFAFARPVDINGNDQNDFLVQRFRSVGYKPTNAGANDPPVAFTMGVRVYDSQATGTGNLPTDPASLGMTGGTGQRSQRPLAALYTTIAVGDNPDSLCDMIRHLNNQKTTPLSEADLNLPPTCAAPADDSSDDDSSDDD